VVVGGICGTRPKLSQELVKDLSANQGFELMEKIIAFYNADAKPHQRLKAMIDKIGFEEFQAKVFG